MCSQLFFFKSVVLLRTSRSDINRKSVKSHLNVAFNWDDGRSLPVSVKMVRCGVFVLQSLLTTSLLVHSVLGAKGGGRRAIFRSSGIGSQNNPNYEKYSSHRTGDYDDCEYRVISRYWQGIIDTEIRPIINLYLTIWYSTYITNFQYPTWHGDINVIDENGFKVADNSLCDEICLAR